MNNIQTISSRLDQLLFLTTILEIECRHFEENQNPKNKFNSYILSTILFELKIPTLLFPHNKKFATIPI